MVQLKQLQRQDCWEEGEENQACSHIQFSRILSSQCLAWWVFLGVMAEGKDALGPSYPLSVDVPLETGVISELAP